MADGEQTKVVLTVDYGNEPGLGSLGYDLVEVDRGFRAALREARTGEVAPRVWRSPRLDESAKVVRATTNSPLTIEAWALVEKIVEPVLVSLITAEIAARFRKRPLRRPRARVTIRSKGQDVPEAQATIVVEGERVEVDLRARGEGTDDEPTEQDG